MQSVYFSQKNFLSAYVVFVDYTNLWWLKFLKRGFRHCYIILDFEKFLIEVNSYSNKMVIKAIDNKNYLTTLQVFHKAKVIKTSVNLTPERICPISCFTCVEAVKRILGIQNFFIITPYSLYRKLLVVGK